MAGKQDTFLELRNFRKVQKVLEDFSKGADLSWFDEAANAITRRWYFLARQHIRAARELATSGRNWRSIISRCYYAVYNGSKCVRYSVSGSVKLDVTDHQSVGDLPDDFPDKAQWSNFAIELRRDRNLADYEPWDHVRGSLTNDPDTALNRTIGFVKTCRHYLRERGVPV